MRQLKRLHVRVVVLIATGFALGSTGCTVRYSQAMVARITRPSVPPYTQESTGFDFALGGFSALGGISFSEPTPASRQLQPTCRSVLGQVDYRSTWFIIPFLINPTFITPKVRVTSFCVQ